MRAVLSWSRFYTRNRTAKGESNASGRAVVDFAALCRLPTPVRFPALSK